MVSYFFFWCCVVPTMVFHENKRSYSGPMIFSPVHLSFFSIAPSYYIESFSIILGLAWKTVDIFTGESIIIYLAFYWGWGMSMMRGEHSRAMRIFINTFYLFWYCILHSLIMLLHTTIHLSYQTFEDGNWSFFLTHECSVLNSKKCW